MILEEYQQLESKLKRLQSDADRAMGAREQILASIKKEFKVDSLEEAKILVKKLEKETEAAEREYEKSLKKFEDEWAEKLEALK